MKKAKFITGVMACVLAALAVTGCDLELSDADNRLSTADKNKDVEAITTTLNGTTVSGYALNFYKTETDRSSVIKTIDGYKAIDANAASTTSVYDYDDSAKVSWSNPLSGLTLSDGVTITFDVYTTTLTDVCNLLSFIPSGVTSSTTWLLYAFESDGGFHINAGLSTWADWAGAISATTWSTVTAVLNSDGTIDFYNNGVEQTTVSNDSITYSGMQTFLNTTVDKIAVGAPNASYITGVPPAGTYIKNIRIYTSALTAAQVAALD